MIKKALISPNELIFDKNFNFPVLLGYRIVQVADESFDVADPLFWVDFDDTIIFDFHTYYYDPNNNIILKIPEVIDESF